MARRSGTVYEGIGTPEHFRWLRGIVNALLVLNLLDALFTLIWVSLGLAREANPVLNHLIVDSPVLFVSAKLALVGLGSWLLWHLRERSLAVVAIFAAFLVYYWILVYHVGYLGVLLGRLTGA